MQTMPGLSRTIILDPKQNRTYHYWHVFVPGHRPGTDLWLSCLTARTEPERGMRFDPAKVLLDPYGRAVVVPEGIQPQCWRAAGRQLRYCHEERGGGPALL